MHATDLSHRLTRLVLGIDAFYRQGAGDGESPLDREGLVPVHWSPLEPLAVDGWAEAKAALTDCVRDAALVADPWSRDWLGEQALSLLVLCRWLSGEDLAYEEVVAGALRVDPRPPSARALQRLRARRDDALQRAGYASWAAYAEAERVAPNEVQSLMEELIAEAEARTRRRLPGLKLPPHPIGVRVVDGTPFTAYCDYPGRQVWINTDVPHTRAGLKGLVGHEAYPGHYAHMGHRHALVAAGVALADSALVVTNSASSVLFEGIAECGLDLIGWRDEPDDEIAWLHNRLQWLASIEAAHALNTGRAGSAEIAEGLRRTCDADDAWIDGKLRFVGHPLRAPFVYSYWWGGSTVGAWWRGVPARRFDEAVAYLYDRMHSPSTLPAHWFPEVLHEG